jgi:hypothetical protein
MRPDKAGIESGSQRSSALEGAARSEGSVSRCKGLEYAARISSGCITGPRAHLRLRAIHL